MTTEVPRHGLPRSSLACLACRAAKSKCDGLVPSALATPLTQVEDEANSLSTSAETVTDKSARAANAERCSDPVLADASCSRCIRLGHVCSWKPSLRAGRPPGKRKRQSLLHETDKHDTTVEHEDPVRHHSYSSSSSSSQGSVNNDLALNKDDLSGCAMTLGSDPTFSLGEMANIDQDQYDVFAEFLQQCSMPTGPAAASINGDAVISCGDDKEKDHASPSSLDQITNMRKRIWHLDNQSQSSTSSTSDLCLLPTYGASAENGVSRFFSGIGLSVPLYESCDDLLFRLSDCDTQLLAAAALGHVLYEGAEGPSYHAMRQQSLRSVDTDLFRFGLTSSNVTTRVSHIAALILIVYADYGCEEWQLLEHHLNVARTAAMEGGLQHTDHSAGPFANLPVSPRHVEAARQTWWELWVLDCIMDVVSSGKVARRFQNLRPSVNIPGRKSGPMHEVWSLRVRAVSLLVDAVTASSFSKNVERVQGADVMQANVIAEAQALILTTTRTLQANARSGVADSNQTISRHVILFDCLMMLHASRIHLHRLFWFSDLTLDLESCSFQRKSSEHLVDNQAALHSAQSGIDIASSVDKIVQSADSILHLMQLDIDTFFWRSLGASRPSDSANVLPICSPHWPPIGCCQMVASYGLVVGVAAGARVRSQLDTTFVPGVGTGVGLSEEQISAAHGGKPTSSQSDLESRKQECTAQGSQDCATGMVRDLWRAEQSVSSIGLAEASLGALSEVWPVAATYRGQVHLCRLAIDHNISPLF